MILIDFPGEKGYSHMVGSTIKELHEFAESMGIKKCWFENKRGKNRPHYDVHRRLFHVAVEAGAQIVISELIVKFCIEQYGTNTKLSGRLTRDRTKTSTDKD